MATTPGWYADPSGRFEHRYHNGVSWTGDVATGGQRYLDPPGGGAPAPAPPGSNPAAVAGLVTGIVACALGWVPIFAFLAVLAGVTALVLGLNARRTARRRGGARAGMATAATVLGAVGIAVSAVGIVLSVVLIRAVQRYEDPADHNAAITTCVLTDDLVTAAGSITNTSDSPASFTLRLSLARGDGDRRRKVVSIDDLAAGASRTFEASGFPDGDGDPACEIERVRGPLPWGIDPEPNG
jgi:hypothetical protein